MRPIKLEMQAFGPFKGYEPVDFEHFSKARLFLITGETGSGKSTILDAMMFALYNTSSGNIRNKFEDMRCRMSDKATETFVKLTFEADGRIYRFERQVRSTGKNTKTTRQALIQNENGIFEPLFENPKDKDVIEKAKELVGLTDEQFRQVVILPQGKFEQFLVAPSDEKEKLLSSIFGVDKWSKIAACFSDIAKAAYDASNKERDEINTLLTAEGCGSLEDLKAQMSGLQEEKKQLEAVKASAHWEERAEKLKAQRTLSGRFMELHKAEMRRQQLKEKEENAVNTQAALDLARRAEGVRPMLKALSEAEENLKARRKDAENEAARLAAAQQAKLKVDEAAEAWKSKEAEADKFGRVAVALGEKREIYSNLSALEKGFAQAETDCRSKAAALKKTETLVVAGRQKVQDAFALWQAEKARYEEMLVAYMSGISGELAEKLEEGQPCPVCGSSHHPNPAQKAIGAVSRDELDQCEIKRNRCEAAWKQADAKRQQDEQVLAEAQKTLHDAQAVYENKKAALEAARAGLVKGIDSLKALETRIADLTGQVEAYKRKLQKLNDQKNEAAQNLAAIVAREATARDEATKAAAQVRSATTALEKAIADNGFADCDAVKKALRDPEKQQAAADSLQAYKTSVAENAENLKNLREELAGKTEVAAADLNEAEKALTEEQNKYNRDHATLVTRLEKLGKIYENLEKRAKAYEDSRLQIEADYSFAKTLRGDTGIGLQRYVLGVMFSSVIASANQMLMQVHDGRYRLMRSDEKGKGNKRGLELYVHDAYAETDDIGRNVGTLSGGEKFLVSLAMSIGLSNVARRSGVHLDAMFIDEGFGTLDANSINDAMDVLQSVQTSSGMVGIISHVEVLRSNISTKLLVEKGKGDDGSHVRMSEG
ncbi:MAG: SMC family ATPase [Lachnospiraceae bacterium]|nr:SMC family ATPase [Lachnospiraceae bacterium]